VRTKALAALALAGTIASVTLVRDPEGSLSSRLKRLSRRPFRADCTGDSSSPLLRDASSNPPVGLCLVQSWICNGIQPDHRWPYECGYQLQRASGLFACGPAAAIAPGITTSVPPPDTPWAWLIG
jgi:hypothetical protein